MKTLQMVPPAGSAAAGVDLGIVSYSKSWRLRNHLVVHLQPPALRVRVREHAGEMQVGLGTFSYCAVQAVRITTHFLTGRCVCPSRGHDVQAATYVKEFRAGAGISLRPAFGVLFPHVYR